jgi:deazaflavin-dependent oxidoreductase (nitroreductase family)
MTEQPAQRAMSWNERIIKEFRENGGKVGGMFEGAPMVLLTTEGRKTVKPHTTPTIYYEDGARYLVFASNLGRPENPDWYKNIVANSQVTMEIGTEDGGVKKLATRGVPLAGEERDRFYELQSSLRPAFREYQEKTTRVIPVVALYPLDLSQDSARNRMVGEQLVLHHNQLRARLAGIREEIAGDLGETPGGTGGSPADLLTQLRQHCLRFCYGLQMHHIREDGSFTAFEEQFPDLVPVITKLREEHVVIEKELASLEALLEELASGGQQDIERLRAEVERVVSGLEEHFAYEEEHLLPAVNTSQPQ